MDTKNNKENKTSPEIVGLKELKEGSKIRVKGIAEAEIEFVDTTEGSETFHQKVKRKQLVLKASIDNGKDVLIPASEKTVIFNEMQSLIESRNYELPVKLIDEVFTVGIRGSGIQKYPYFTELYNNVDYSHLFDE